MPKEVAISPTPRGLPEQESLLRRFPPCRFAASHPCHLVDGSTAAGSCQVDHSIQAVRATTFGSRTQLQFSAPPRGVGMDWHPTHSWKAPIFAESGDWRKRKHDHRLPTMVV